MRTSSRRILTTHAGSLPRPQDLLDLLQAPGGSGSSEFGARLPGAVVEVVRQQADTGLDVIDDGEFGKPSFVTYISERLSGFEAGGPRGTPWVGSRETISFPDFYAAQARAAANPGIRAVQMVCTAPIAYRGHAALRRDIANFKAALKQVNVEEAFMPAISPANVEAWQKNEYYKSGEEYLFAIADGLHEEYKAIADAGFLVQVDDPRLITYWILNPAATLAECRKWASLRIDALNHALRGIPEEKIRFHTCYSINMGPRVHDMELKDIVDLILKIRAGAYSFEAANPRHEHEWGVWKDVKLRSDKLLIPGCITQSTVLVEHPELVAERIERYARVVGRERVIAGADCGFATFAGSTEIHPSVAWAKLRSLVEGARIASRRLWAQRKRAAKPKRRPAARSRARGRA